MAMIGYHAGYHKRYHFWITLLRDKLGKSIGWRGVILFPSPAPRAARLSAIRAAPQFPARSAILGLLAPLSPAERQATPAVDLQIPLGELSKTRRQPRLFHVHTLLSPLCPATSPP
ncbi:hypothetical protein XAB3213_3720013 [Xanthomonas citri pv. bilvae]|nr:hypothetical protein XAB3213_3720013 [Xanthomonas citri pv. bilvae]